MSSLRIWCKFVQLFPVYTNKKVADSAKKQNLTQFTACGNQHAKSRFVQRLCLDTIDIQQMDRSIWTRKVVGKKTNTLFSYVCIPVPVLAVPNGVTICCNEVRFEVILPEYHLTTGEFLTLTPSLGVIHCEYCHK